ncbi:MAG: ferritin [Myxococcaceae bacterium]|nr:ferritin [Myxococcaceae bacterium]
MALKIQATPPAVPPIDIGISEKDRTALAEGLQQLLSDTATLYLKTHNFHWNVTGPMFQTLHQMFETQYNELWQAEDEIAERIRALGVPVVASNGEWSQLSAVPEEKGVPDATEMVRRLVRDHETVVRTARKLFVVADSANDESTADLLTQRLQIHEKTAWMLRSLLA